VATALVAPDIVHAQATNALGLDSLAFAQLQADVGDQDSVRVRGTFGQVVLRRPTLTPDSLFAGMASEASGPRLSLRDVTRIQTRGGSAATGALVGAGVGLAGGLAAALGLTSSLCNDGLGCSNKGGATVVITVGFTAAGALLGSVIGAPIKKWHTVHPAR